MKKFTKEIIDQTIIFKDEINKKEIKVKHYDDECIFDILKISEDLDYKFIDYIITELQKTNDISLAIFLFQNDEIENLIHKHNLKILNYNYEIPYQSFKLRRNYIVSSKLNAESKEYYLKILNEENQKNHLYLSPNEKYQPITEKCFLIEGWQYLIYKLNAEIVGVVDFEIFDDEIGATDELYNYNNAVCIRCLFANNKEIASDILKDLLNRFKKRIIISHQYTNDNLKTAISDINGEFKYISAINKN